MRALRLSTSTAIVLASMACMAAPALAADAEGAPSDIVVTATRLEKTARKEQQLAPNLVNIQSAEAIAKYPDYNAAEALSRIPGVQLSIDTGEGRFVSIRGIDGNLNGATFGGAVLLNTNAGGVSFTGSGRAVEFDTIPVGAIDRIVVTKTGLPDHDAEGIGGSVELTPRSALGHDKLFVEATLGEGYEPTRKTTNFNEEFVIGGGFGDNGNGGKLFHLVLTQNEHNDGRGFDDIEVGSYADTPGILNNSKIEDKVVSGYDLRRYRYHRERYGYSANLEITPNSDHRIFLRANYAGYQERVNRLIVQVNGLDGGNGTIAIDPTKPNTFDVTGVSLRNTLRDEKESHRNTVAQIGGEHHFNKVKLDWMASYERAVFDKPYDYNTRFSGPSGLTATYDNVTDPNFPKIAVIGASIADPSIYKITRFGNSVEYTADREYSYHASLSFPVGLASNDEFKFGGVARYRQKFDIYTGGINASIANGSPLTAFQGDGPFNGYYNGLYNLGYEGNAPLLAQKYGSLVQIPAGQPFNTTNTNYLLFNDTENVIAGYAQYAGDVAAFHFVLGGRLERTKEIYGGFSNVQNTPSDKLDPVGGNYLIFPTKSYTNFFPNIQLKYSFSPKFIARAVYSTNISRPGFNQTAQQQNVANSDPTALAVTNGNPNLNPTYSHNFDLSFEYYLPNSGLISVGFYDKEINNFVVARAFKQQATYGGVSGLYTFTSFANVSGTYDRGIEASYVNKFTHLPAPFDGLGVETNVNYNVSKVALHDGQPKQAIPGTFKYSGNAAIFYEKGALRLRLAFKYDSSSVFGINGGGFTPFAYANIGTDNYLGARATLDLTGGYDFSKRVAIFGSIKNLTDAPLKYYEGTSNRPIQREFYGATYEAGVKVKL